MFYLFPRAVRPDVCEQIVQECKQKTFEEAGIYTYPAEVIEADKELEVWVENPKIRKTKVTYITDRKNKINELVLSYLREANRIQFNYNLTFFQAVQFAEYKDGGFYDWHQDEGNIDKSNEVRKLSLTLALSNPDTFEGGELQFYNGGRPMEDMGGITAEQVTSDIKAQGTVVVFDSRDYHRVTPVTKGVRHSIVCWIVGPNFK
tara:strand:- start:712 stop:1323 length:612 start_codon:yes stop_codon:yes gene_type:complete